MLSKAALHEVFAELGQAGPFRKAPERRGSLADPHEAALEH